MAVANVSIHRSFEREQSLVRPPVLIQPGVLVTDQSAWAFFVLEGRNTDSLEEPEADRFTLDTAAELQSLIDPDIPYHVKVLWSPYDPDSYREAMARVPGPHAPGFASYVEMGAARITTLSNPDSVEGGNGVVFRRRTVLFGVQVDEKTLKQGWRDSRAAAWAGKIPGVKGPAAVASDAHTRLAATVAARKTLTERFATATCLRASPAPAGVLEWAWTREWNPAVTSPPARETTDRVRLAGIVHGQAHRDTPAYVRVTDHAGTRERFVAVLVPAAAHGFVGTELPFPGGEWIQAAGEIPGVEVSVRGEHRGRAGSVKRLDQAGRSVESQVREAADAGTDPPEEILLAREVIAERKQQVQRREAVLATHHIRFVVSGSTAGELESRVTALTDRYAGMISLYRPENVQDLLWCETLPGDLVRVPEFVQEQPLLTLAGSWFHGGSIVGDECGPYIGEVVGHTPLPVQCHLLRRDGGHADDAVVVVMTGKTGFGKSTLAMLLVLGALAEGAWAGLVDLKGDLYGLTVAAEQLLGVPTQAIEAHEPEAAGLLDPLRMWNHDPADARTQAGIALHLCLHDHEIPRFSLAIELAINHVITTTDPQHWSMPAVLGVLAASDREDWRELAETLQARGQNIGLRPVLHPPTDQTARILDSRGLVYLNLKKLPFPDSSDRTSWSPAHRAAMVCLQMAIAFLHAQARNHPALKKMVYIPELHRFTKFTEGRSMVEWLARTGRALKVHQILDTQAAADITGVDALKDQLVTAFAFYSDSHTERRAVAELLRRPDPGPKLLTTMGGLQRGEAVMLDRYGRTGHITIDRMTDWLADTLSTRPPEDVGETTTELAPEPATDTEPVAAEPELHQNTPEVAV